MTINKSVVYTILNAQAQSGFGSKVAMLLDFPNSAIQIDTTGNANITIQALMSEAETMPTLGQSVYNAQIVTSISSNNLTVALKTLAGNDPSASDPVTIVQSDGSARQITSSLSTTSNAGTNWLAMGGTTKTAYIYLLYSTNSGHIGWNLYISLLPSATKYSDFTHSGTSATGAIGFNNDPASAGDLANIVSSFSITLGAGATYYWSANGAQTYIASISPWETVQLYDASNTSTAITGSTGIVASGADIHKTYVVNFNNPKYLTLLVSNYTAGSVTALVRANNIA